LDSVRSAEPSIQQNPHPSTEAGATPSGVELPAGSADGSRRELTFDDVGKAIGNIGGEPRTGVRYSIMGAVTRALNHGGAASFAEAFRIFEAERPDWQQELADAPPPVAPGAHVIDMPEGAIEADLLQIETLGRSTFIMKPIEDR
jgi:hypothetical protein